MQKARHQFAKAIFFEFLFYCLVGTAAWAIADRCALSGLDRSFYADVGNRWSSRIVGIIAGLIVVANGYFVYRIKRAGRRDMFALGVLIFTGGLASLYFLPTRLTVIGLGAVIGAALLFWILRALYAGARWSLRKTWAGLSWPFRKAFGRKTVDVTDPPEQTKTVSSDTH